MIGNAMLADSRANVELAKAGLAAKQQLLSGHPIDALKTHFTGQLDAFKTRAAGVFGQNSFQDRIQYSGGTSSAGSSAGLIPKPEPE
jgi:hypothetical protein